MVAKAVLVLCALALLAQSISAQCLGTLGLGAINAPCAAVAPLGIGTCGAWDIAGPARALAASNGPGLAISSASPISPVGVSVASENAIEGALAVTGALPFLGTVGLEGVLPTTGAGNVAYNCGNGAVAITAEDIAAANVGLGIGALGLGAGALGLGAGPLGLAAGPLGIGAGPLGIGTGPLGVGALGLGMGGCGCGGIIV
ncbi:chorion class B protein PC10-like [Aricia agestis]|uniref:chorion class B protein PC10-like n=1 Tax=Aricia agestis TaxID=91739 RepID=UPI001C209F72|nr:chorion class B protein PC10-like [Aricia agestis]